MITVDLRSPEPSIRQNSSSGAAIISTSSRYVSPGYDDSPLDQVRGIFPDICPDYLEQVYMDKLQSLLTGEHLVQAMTDFIISNDEYPKAKREQKRQTKSPADRDVKRQKVAHDSQHDPQRATGRQDDPILLDSDSDEAEGPTVECKCCFSEFPVLDMVACANDDTHLFCTDCVKSYINSLLEQSKWRATCMASSVCEGQLKSSQMKGILDTASITRLERLQQEEDLRLAGIEGLEGCPFCDFKAILPPIEEDRELRCQDPVCGEISCRLCRKRSHVPKSCEEAVTDQKDKARHQIEEAMTEALVRSCNNCKRPFLKDDGCNKMTCPNCGNKQCYVCRETIAGYDHFGAGKCPQADDTVRRHEEEVRKAQKDAKEKVLRAANPDINLTDADVEVKFSNKVEEESKRRLNARPIGLDFHLEDADLRVQIRAARAHAYNPHQPFFAGHMRAAEAAGRAHAHILARPFMPPGPRLPAPRQFPLGPPPFHDYVVQLVDLLTENLDVARTNIAQARHNLEDVGIQALVEAQVRVMHVRYPGQGALLGFHRTIAALFEAMRQFFQPAGRFARPDQQNTGLIEFQRMEEERLRLEVLGRGQALGIENSLRALVQAAYHVPVHLFDQAIVINRERSHRLARPDYVLGDEFRNRSPVLRQRLVNMQLVVQQPPNYVEQLPNHNAYAAPVNHPMHGTGFELMEDELHGGWRRVAGDLAALNAEAGP